MPTLGDISQFIIAFAVAVNAWQSYRNGRKIDVVHDATNSMKDALVASTEKESYARGMKAGVTQGEISSMNINHREDK
jgi:hypothetical protein